tara:strand:- start:89 stop:256 length:168 start_codon:yes stop_codon:yes gene_type:complete
MRLAGANLAVRGEAVVAFGLFQTQALLLALGEAIVPFMYTGTSYSLPNKGLRTGQ